MSKLGKLKMGGRRGNMVKKRRMWKVTELELKKEEKKKMTGNITKGKDKENIGKEKLLKKERKRGGKEN